MEDQNLDKVLLIDKPYRWTSFDVVNKLRHKLKIKKVGHAGTLDPLATGLLIVCTGKMTREIEKFMGLEKEYTGTMVLGHTTASHDLETEVTFVAEVSSVTEQAILATAAELTGRILQLPPVHSAIRVAGRRAYEFARKGRDIKLEPREVEVSTFDITAINLPEVRFRIVCSKGTYIRSIIRDFGERLGVGAYLSQLCRTRIGHYRLSDALTVDQIAP